MKGGITGRLKKAKLRRLYVYVCLCMYMCMSVYVYVYVYVYVCVCVCLYLCVCACACIFMFMCMCVYVYVYVCVVYECVCVYLCLCVCAYVFMFMFIYIYACLCMCVCLCMFISTEHNFIFSLLISKLRNFLCCLHSHSSLSVTPLLHRSRDCFSIVLAFLHLSLILGMSSFFSFLFSCELFVLFCVFLFAENTWFWVYINIYIYFVVFAWCLAFGCWENVRK